MTLELVVSIVTRATLGFFGAVFAGFAGFLLGWTVIFPDTQSASVLTPGMVTIVAISCGIAAVPAWDLPPVSRRRIISVAVAALAGAAAAGWLGFALASGQPGSQLVDAATMQPVEYGGPLHELFTRQAIRNALFAASFGANVVAGAVYAFMAIRDREL